MFAVATKTESISVLWELAPIVGLMRNSAKVLLCNFFITRGLVGRRINEYFHASTRKQFSLFPSKSYSLLAYLEDSNKGHGIYDPIDKGINICHSRSAGMNLS